MPTKGLLVRIDAGLVVAPAVGLRACDLLEGVARIGLRIARVRRVLLVHMRAMEGLWWMLLRLLLRVLAVRLVATGPQWPAVLLVLVLVDRLVRRRPKMMVAVAVEVLIAEIDLVVKLHALHGVH